jgi:hypothetical protein
MTRTLAAATAVSMQLAWGAVNAAPTCDRACLNGFADRYLEALVAKDASRLPVAADVKFTENLVPLQIGTEGLWRTVTGRGTFNLYVADTKTGVATWTGVVEEMDRPVFMSLRLRVENGHITEAESLVGRVALTGADKAITPRPDFARIEPAATRSSREKLAAIVSAHWDNMEQGRGDLTPYTDDCERYDNGHLTTGTGHAPPAGKQPDGNGLGLIGKLDCRGQMASGRFRNGNRVEPRRVWAIDEERGVVVGYYSPNVPGTARSVTVFGESFDTGPDEKVPFTIQQVEIFKIVDGRISRVEVTLGPRVPYGMRSPFDMQTLWKKKGARAD